VVPEYYSAVSSVVEEARQRRLETSRPGLETLLRRSSTSGVVLPLLSVALLCGERAIDAGEAFDHETAQRGNVGVRVEPGAARVGERTVRERRRVQPIDELVGDGIAPLIPDALEHREVPFDERLEQRGVARAEEALGRLAHDRVAGGVDVDERRPRPLL